VCLEALSQLCKVIFCSDNPNVPSARAYKSNSFPEHPPPQTETAPSANKRADLTRRSTCQSAPSLWDTDPRLVPLAVFTRITFYSSLDQFPKDVELWKDGGSRRQDVVHFLRYHKTKKDRKNSIHVEGIDRNFLNPTIR
jgi:hypothetical protein